MDRLPYPLRTQSLGCLDLHAAKEGELIIELPKEIQLFNLRRETYVKYVNYMNGAGYCVQTTIEQ